MEKAKYVQLIASQCRARGNLGAKILEGMFTAMPSYATNAAAAIFALHHIPCKDVSARYLAAILNDMSRSSGLVHELLEGNRSFLEVRLLLRSVRFSHLNVRASEYSVPSLANPRHLRQVKWRIDH